MVTTIKFLATDVVPKPDEVDYWVDIADNPYKGTIKYFNGVEWIRLQDLGGDLDLTKYYSKSEVNNLLNEKASVSSVESKLDDEEASSLIKNIYADSTVNELKLISTKQDGSTIILNVPIADNGHTGVITSDKYKDIVTKAEKQAIYTELYAIAENIRAQYQRKLVAGANIKIEDNIISATGGGVSDWDSITNKPEFASVATTGNYNDLVNKLVAGNNVSISSDNVINVDLGGIDLSEELNKKADKADTYTKAQVDQKVSSVYRIKGSVAYTQLPASGNTIGDTYNITDDFTLGNKEYTAGTNIVYTESGWDALSGAFDTTAIESSITEVTNKITQETNRATAVENTKVDKVEGKQLSTNDYTTTEKTKLAGIADNANNYNLPIASSTTLGGIQLGYTINDKTYPVVLDANSKAYVNIPWTDTVYTHPAHTSYINGLYKVTVDALGHVSMATPVVKEDIVALGISGDDFQISIVNDEPTLEWGTVSTIGNINGVDLTVKMLSKPIYTWIDITSKPTFATVATSGKYSDLIDTPTIPNAVTESTVSNWGFIKNIETYSKPSTGIPKIDLASDIQVSLDKADTALQSYTEKYTGTVTGVKLNGDTNSPTNGIVDLGNVLTSHQDITGLATKSELTIGLAAKQNAINSTNKLSYSYIDGIPVLATVATSGKYSDLIGLPTIPTVPTTLKNPTALTFGTKTYDGSVAAIILASDLGALTSHQTLNTLTISRNGTAVDTYNPSASKTINVNAATSLTVPTGLTAGALTTAGVIALSFTSGYSIPTTAKQSQWDTAYTFVNDITGDGADGFIDKWSDIISFLDGIEDSVTLDSIISGINNSVTTEVSRATTTENTIANNLSTHTSNSAIHFTTTERTKLSNIADGANNYSLPVATSTALGGVKLGFTEGTKTYKLQVDISNNAYVSVPWTDTLYTHPSATAYSSGLYKITTNALGHVTSATAVTKSDITSLGIPSSDTTYTTVTSTNSGLMSSTDKNKLDGIETNANKYILPTASSTVIGGVSIGTGISDSSGNISVIYGATAETACQGNDSRLSNSRPASDVSSWAKASTKPTYTASEVGAAPTSHVHSEYLEKSYYEGSNAVTTLASLPVSKRLIIATLSAATNISVASALSIGQELHIVITASADIEQPLPVSNGWSSLDGDTLSIASGKKAEISILCVGTSIYCISSKSEE